jgi:hypothetical protein
MKMAVINDISVNSTNKSEEKNDLWGCLGMAQALHAINAEAFFRNLQ